MLTMTVATYKALAAGVLLSCLVNPVPHIFHMNVITVLDGGHMFAPVHFGIPSEGISTPIARCEWMKEQSQAATTGKDVTSMSVLTRGSHQSTSNTLQPCQLSSP